MTGSSHETSEQIDHRTSRSICDAVGERLRLDLKPERLASSGQIEHLLDEMRRREAPARR